MLHKIEPYYRHVENFNSSDYVVWVGCDNCTGSFLFVATVRDEKGRPTTICGEYFQFNLVKFCPYCGARNTKPKPVAHKD